MVNVIVRTSDCGRISLVIFSMADGRLKPSYSRTVRIVEPFLSFSILLPSMGKRGGETPQSQRPLKTRGLQDAFSLGSKPVTRLSRISSVESRCVESVKSELLQPAL